MQAYFFIVVVYYAVKVGVVLTQSNTHLLALKNVQNSYQPNNPLYKLAGSNAHPQLMLKAGDCLPAV